MTTTPTAPAYLTDETQPWLTRYIQELDAERAARPPIEEWTTLNLVIEIERITTRHSEHHAWDDTSSGPDDAEYHAAWRELIRRWHYDADPVAAEYVDGARHHLDPTEGA